MQQTATLVVLLVHDHLPVCGVVEDGITDLSTNTVPVWSCKFEELPLNEYSTVLFDCMPVPIHDEIELRGWILSLASQGKPLCSDASEESTTWSPQ